MRRCANSETRPAADLKFGDTEWERAAALPLPAGVQAPPARSRRDITGNGLSKLFLTIAAAFAEADRDRIRERIGQVKSDQKARDRYLAGKSPSGSVASRAASSSHVRRSKKLFGKSCRYWRKENLV